MFQKLDLNLQVSSSFSIGVQETVEMQIANNMNFIEAAMVLVEQN